MFKKSSQYKRYLSFDKEDAAQKNLKGEDYDYIISKTVEKEHAKKAFW